MTAVELLSQLTRRGVCVGQGPDPTTMAVDAPADVLTPGDLAALRADKASLLALLADLEQLERNGTAAQLRAVAATLTPVEHRRLAAEAAAGDRLAGLICAMLASCAPAEEP
jgi:hypothetical protein